MNVADLIGLVRRKLDEPESSYLTDDDILAMLNEAQRALARDIHFYEDTTSYPIEGWVSTYSIPDLLEIFGVYYIDDGGSARALTPVSLRNLDMYVTHTSTSGTPVYYCRLGRNTVLLLPVPAESAGTLEVTGLYIPPDMVYDPQNPDQNVDPSFPEEDLEAVLAWCRYNFAAMQDDPNQASYWQEVYERELRRARSSLAFSDRPHRVIPRYY